MREWKNREQIAGVENARVEKSGAICHLATMHVQCHRRTEQHTGDNFIMPIPDHITYAAWSAKMLQKEIKTSYKTYPRVLDKSCNSTRLQTSRQLNTYFTIQNIFAKHRPKSECIFIGRPTAPALTQIGHLGILGAWVEQSIFQLMGT